MSESSNVKWFVGAVLVPVLVACIGAGVAISQGACLPLICSDSNGPGPGPGPGTDETKVFLSKLSGPSGTEVNVSGSGFQPNETVTIRFHTDEVGSTTVDSTGSFSNIAVTIPDMPGSGPFQFSIVVTGNSSVRHAQAAFTLTD